MTRSYYVIKVHLSQSLLCSFPLLVAPDIDIIMLFSGILPKTASSAGSCCSSWTLCLLLKLFTRGCRAQIWCREWQYGATTLIYLSHPLRTHNMFLSTCVIIIAKQICVLKFLFKHEGVFYDYLYLFCLFQFYYTLCRLSFITGVVKLYIEGK